MKKTRRKNMVSIMGMISMRGFFLEVLGSLMGYLFDAESASSQAGRIGFDGLRLPLDACKEIIVGDKGDHRHGDAGGSADERLRHPSGYCVGLAETGHCHDVEGVHHAYDGAEEPQKR